MLEPRTRPKPNIAPFTTSGLSMACVIARRTRTSENGFFELFSARITSFVVSPWISWRFGERRTTSTDSGPRPNAITSMSPAWSAARAALASGMNRNVTRSSFGKPLT